MDKQSSKDAFSAQTNTRSSDIFKASDIAGNSSVSSVDSSLVHVSRETSLPTAANDVKTEGNETGDNLPGAQLNIAVAKAKQFPTPENSGVLTEDQHGTKPDLNNLATSQDLDNSDGNIAVTPESFVILNGEEAESPGGSPSNAKAIQLDFAIAGTTSKADVSDSENTGPTGSPYSDESIVVLSERDFQKSDASSAETLSVTSDEKMTSQSEVNGQRPSLGDELKLDHSDADSSQRGQESQVSDIRGLTVKTSTNEDSDDDITLDEESGLNSLLDGYNKDETKLQLKKDLTKSRDSAHDSSERLDDPLDLTNSDGGLLNASSSLLAGREDIEGVENILAKMPDLVSMDPLDTAEVRSNQETVAEGESRSAPFIIYPPIGRSFSMEKADDGQRLEARDETADAEKRMMDQNCSVQEVNVMPSDQMNESVKPKQIDEVQEAGTQETFKADSSLDNLINSRYSPKSENDKVMVAVNNGPFDDVEMELSLTMSMSHIPVSNDASSQRGATQDQQGNGIEIDKPQTGQNPTCAPSVEQRHGDKDGKNPTVADALSSSFSLLNASSSFTKDQGNFSQEIYNGTEVQESSQLTADKWSFPDEEKSVSEEKKAIWSLSSAELRSKIRVALERFRDESRDLQNETDMVYLVQELEVTMTGTSESPGVETVTAVVEPSAASRSTVQPLHSEEVVTPDRSVTNQSSPEGSTRENTELKRLGDYDQQFSLQISEQQTRLFRFFDGEKVLGQEYGVLVILDPTKLKVELSGAPVKVNKAVKLIQNNEWLTHLSVRTEKFDPSVIALLIQEQTRDYVDSELHKTVDFQFCWNVFYSHGSIVIYAENKVNTQKVAEIIKCLITTCTQKLSGGEDYLRSSEWYHLKNNLHQRFYGKLQISDEVNEQGEVVFVCTEDVVSSVREVFNSNAQMTSDDSHIVKENKNSNSDVIGSYTEIIEMKDEIFKYIKCWHKAEIEELSSDLEVEVVELSTGNSNGYLLKGKKLETLKSYIKNAVHSTEVKCHELKSNEAIQLFQKNDYQGLRELETRHKCCIIVEQDGTPMAVPVVASGSGNDKSDYPAFNLYGVEIKVQCGKTEVIDGDMIVQPTDALHVTVYGSRRVVYCENHKRNTVQVIVPDWSKPNKRNQFVDRLEDLYRDVQKYGLASLLFPVQNFRDWPFGKLVKAVIMALKPFKDKADFPLRKIVFCDPDQEICQNVCHIVCECVEDHGSGATKEVVHTQAKKKSSPGIMITVEKGEIAKQKVDVIVNTTSKSLDLNQGGVSHSILKRAGQGLQRRVNELYPTGVRLGEVAASPAYSLDCQKVYHGALEPWPQYHHSNHEEDKCLTVLTKFVWECLNKAHQSKFKTIAFPALGTGNLSIPPVQVAMKMMETVKDFDNKNPETSLEVVKIIIYPKDNYIYKEFTDRLAKHVKKYGKPNKATEQTKPKQQKPTTPTTTVASNPLEVTVDIGDIQLCAGLGDVTKQQGFDGIVMVWFSDKRFSDAAQEDPLLMSIGYEAQDHKRQDFKMSQRGMYVTPAGNLPQKKIIHVYGNDPDVSRVLLKALDLAEQEKDLSSLVIPLRVSDPLSKDCNKYTQSVCRALSQFVDQRKQSSHLRKVKICVSGQHLLSPVIQTLKEIQQAQKIGNQLPKNPRPLIVKVVGRRVTIPDIIADLDNPRSSLLACHESAVVGQVGIPQSEALLDAEIPRLSLWVCPESKTMEEVAIPNITQDMFEAFLFFERLFLQHQHAEVNMSYQPNGNKVVFSGPRDLAVKQAKEMENRLKELNKNIFIDIVDVPDQHLQKKGLSKVVHDYQRGLEDILLYIPGPPSNTFHIIGLDQQRVQIIKDKFVSELGLVSSRAERCFDVDDRKPPIPVDARTDVSSFFTSEGLQIKVYTENILRAPVDCIVNAANSNLDHGGGIAQVISNAAGPEFRQECKTYIKKHGKIQVGECCHTGAGYLPYAYVIHTVGPQWNNKKSQLCVQQLQNAIISCIKMASSLGMASIAIPAVSSGIFGTPIEVCAEQYAMATVSASVRIQPTNSSLTEVHFIDCTPNTVSVIKQKFADLFRHVQIAVPSTYTIAMDNESASVVKVTPTTDIEGVDLKIKIDYPKRSEYRNTEKVQIYEYELKKYLKVLVYTGDIMKSKVHAVAFGEDKQLRHNGKIAKKMKELGGKPYDKNLHQKAQAKGPLKFGDVLEVDAGNNFEYLYFALIAISPCFGVDEMPEKQCLSHIEECNYNVLHQAAKLGVHSMAMPLFGTGYDQSTTGQVAAGLHQQIITFFTDMGSNCTLKEVHIVNKADGPTLALKDLFDQYVDRRRREISSQLRNSFKESNKNHVSIPAKVPEDSHSRKVSGDSFQASSREPHPSLTKNAEAMTGTCVICMDDLDQNRKILDKCSHAFCKACIEQQFCFKPVCPTCGIVYGTLMGNQPDGMMTTRTETSIHLPGYEKFGTHVITYDFKDGIQGENHPNPGQSYEGTRRVAYLPACPDGDVVLKLLQLAFERKLTFTIGYSRTTGCDNVVTWNDIHHKTTTHGGPQRFGYPDPEYLERVRDELAIKGVTEKSLTEDM